MIIQMRKVFTIDFIHQPFRITKIKLLYFRGLTFGED